MDFNLTDEQQLFRSSLRQFVEKEIKPVAREWEQAGRFPAEILDGMKQLGLFGLLVPEEYGGMGADMISFALAFEEISRGWMGISGAIGSHSMACWLIVHHGTEDQRMRYLPGMATGERRSGLALTESGAGTDLQSIATHAELRDGVYRVNGTKTWITNARHANPLPVLVKTDPTADPRHRGMSILLIDADTAGFTVSRDLGKLGYRGTETCEVVLEDALVPAENLVGGVEGRGLQQALSALESGRINIAARAVGVSQAAYEAALAYSQERKAFGRPIAELQAIQMKLADLATWTQSARMLTYWAAWMYEQGEGAATAAAMAKLFASEMALKASLEAMRVHGAYGYSTEYEIERLYRDAPLMAIGEGTNEVLRTVIAKNLLRGGGPRS